MITALHSLFAPQRRSRGLTLMELIVVMAILVILMGMSAAVYVNMSKAFKEQGAAADLDVLLRQARNNAISNNAPAFVEIDIAKREITPWVYKTVGQWHFEKVDGYGRSNGAFHNAKLQGAVIYKEGKIGSCVQLRDNACVDVGASSDFDCDDGGCLEAYIKPLTIEQGGSGYIFGPRRRFQVMVTVVGMPFSIFSSVVDPARVSASRRSEKPVPLAGSPPALPQPVRVSVCSASLKGLHAPLWNM